MRRFSPAVSLCACVLAWACGSSVDPQSPTATGGAAPAGDSGIGTTSSIGGNAALGMGGTSGGAATGATGASPSLFGGTGGSAGGATIASGGSPGDEGLPSARDSGMAGTDVTPSDGVAGSGGGGGGGRNFTTGGSSVGGTGGSTGGSTSQDGGSGGTGGNTGGTAGSGGATGASGGSSPGDGGAAGSGGTDSECPCSGNIRYTLNRSGGPNADELDAYDHIIEAMDEAVWYYNCYTDLDKELVANYKSSVGTAEANIDGWISFGSNRSYMVLPTAMHEIAHTLGVGPYYTFAQMTSNGIWTGVNANAVLASIPNPRDTQLHADAMHFWPYGLNYATEYENEDDLIYHCKIVAAIRQDMGI